ncbi:HAD family hydrolase [Herbiconiux daphne]|uniref:HAD family hydrolase n=1 Tax=Herbiconiux daphne TaxID=2970914 RepID=A0ABT2H198_9MICO|nr:HAD family hydrolase [Herbiconiux daphne]MCS5733692.1 HAD family hydrolase [Herbiconiux daphne]
MSAPDDTAPAARKPTAAIEAVLFDVDGTLVDSNYLHVDAWARAFEQVGEPVDTWRIHRAIGLDSQKLLETLLGDRAEAVGDDASELHSSNYKKLWPRLRRFDGAQAIIRRAHESGLRVVLATSAPEEELDELRRVLDIDNLLFAVTNADDVETAKPEPDIIAVALEKAKTDAASALMVGDATWDAVAAGKAGVATVGLRSGGTGEAELRDAGAFAVYDDVTAMLEGFPFDRR